MLLFFGALYAALSARPAPVHDGVLALDLNGAVVEQPAKASFSEIAGGSRIQEYRLRDLIGVLDAARTDDRVKAVSLDLDGFTGGGPDSDVRPFGSGASSARVGQAGVAYGVGFTNAGYELASAASEIWLNPLGTVAIAGPGGTNLYYKGLLDKLGVTANVYRVGTYKSAVEPYIRNDMSPAAKENYTALDQAMLESWLQAIHRARPKANVALFLKDMPGAVDAAGGDMAKAALGCRSRRPDRQSRRVRGPAEGARRRRQGCQWRLPADQARLVPHRQGQREAARADRCGDRRRHDRRRHRIGRDSRRRHHRPRDQRGRRQGHQGADRPRRQPRRVGARLGTHPRSDPARQGQALSRSSSRWAASPHRAAIGCRRRATSSTPSRQPSPDRSACSVCCRASRARSRSSGSAPTGSRRRRCRASRTCCAGHRRKPGD